MVRQEIEVKSYNWHVSIFYAVSCYHTEEIMQELDKIGCEEEFAHRARSNMESCLLDTGLIYSNPQMRESVIVVALASSKEQLENSLRHECQHLVIHIANTCGIDLQSEELCYLAGEIAMLLYPVSHKLTCACDGT